MSQQIHAKLALVDYFYTIHPTDAGESLHANCGKCGAFVDLGIDYFESEEVDITRAMNGFEAAHVCAEPDLYGFLEYYDEKRAAEFYGLPHFF